MEERKNMIFSFLFSFFFYHSIIFFIVKGRSSQPEPISDLNLHVISSTSIQLLPRLIDNHSETHHSLPRRYQITPPPNQLRHNDSILLKFTIPSSSSTNQKTNQWFTLSLRPSQNLIHPQARIIYSSSNPSSNPNQVPLLSEDVLAYSGWSIHPEHHESWWAEEHASVYKPPPESDSIDQDHRIAGWARILFHNHPKATNSQDLQHELVFEGSFQHHNQLWHIKPLNSFLRLRTQADPQPIPSNAHLTGGLVIWSESSSPPSLNPHNVPVKASCAHDQLSFNSDPLHPIHQAAQSIPQLQLTNSFSSSITNFFDHLLGFPSSQPTTTSSSFQNFNFNTSSRFIPPSKTLVRRQSLNGDITWLGNTTASSNFVNSIGSTLGCPSGSRVVFIGVAADCTYVAKYGSQDAARTAILSNVNLVSALYQKTFNISIGVVELNVQSTTCPTNPTSDLAWNTGCPESNSQGGLDLNSRLSVFSDWRGKKGGSDGAGLWHLMTACSSGSEVGVAWLGQLCQVSSESSRSGQVTSGTGVTASTTSEWQVMAHEIGHNFGAIHDCATGCTLSDSCCPQNSGSCNTNGNFIMAPVATKNVSAFSPCTIGNICTSLRSTVNTSCLVTPGQRSVISLQQCGNGIVEPGEDCDPGSNTSSNCCDPRTCKFRSGAVCDPLNGSCCQSNCRFANSSTVCRPVVDRECDQEERCTGSDAICPTDTFVENGKTCGPSGSGLKCAGGMCTSRDEQCKAQGTSLSLTKSCPASATMDCKIACVDPTGRADCIILATNFVDGSDCGYGGKCSGGSCKSGSITDTAESWFKSNLSISIPIAIVAGLVGLMFLVMVFRLVKNCLVSNSRIKNSNSHLQPPTSMPTRNLNNPNSNSFGPIVSHTPIPPPTAAYPRNWVDPSAYNGPMHH